MNMTVKKEAHVKLLVSNVMNGDLHVNFFLLLFATLLTVVFSFNFLYQ